MVEVQPISGEPGAWLLAVKAVPGARCDAIVGPYAGRLKVRVAAPPEGGKANKSICRVLAKALGVRPGAITVVGGLSLPEKTVRIEGATPAAIREMIETNQAR